MNARLPAFAVAIAAAVGLCVRSAQAVPYVVTLQQVGSNVVANGSGDFNLTGLGFSDSGSATSAFMNSSSGVIITGATAVLDDYFGSFSGPRPFGSGGDNDASGIGDFVGISVPPPPPNNTLDFLFVPHGYVSGAPLLSSATWYNETFSILGVTPGTYKWTWGTGADQSFTLDVVATAPDTGSTLGLLFLSLIALFGASRLRSLRLA
jgi:hypothetical protein